MGKFSPVKERCSQASIAKSSFFKDRHNFDEQFKTMMDKITNILQTDSTCRESERSYSEGNVSKCYCDGKALLVKLRANHMNKYRKTLAKELHKLNGFMGRFKNTEKEVGCSLT